MADERNIEHFNMHKSIFERNIGFAIKNLFEIKDYVPEEFKDIIGASEVKLKSIWESVPDIFKSEHQCQKYLKNLRGALVENYVIPVKYLIHELCCRDDSDELMAHEYYFTKLNIAHDAISQVFDFEKLESGFTNNSPKYFKFSDTNIRDKNFIKYLNDFSAIILNKFNLDEKDKKCFFATIIVDSIEDYFRNSQDRDFSRYLSSLVEISLKEFKTHLNKSLEGETCLLFRETVKKTEDYIFEKRTKFTAKAATEYADKVGKLDYFERNNTKGAVLDNILYY
jgi:hypothetical protein